MEYPKYYHDKFNRLSYVLIDKFQKNFYTFYGDSNNIKVKYVSIKNTIYYDAFSRKGKLIISNIDEKNKFPIQKFKNGIISFIVCKEKLKKINNLI